MARARKETDYEIRTAFDVPLEFAFRWCTDFTTDDARYESESYQRRILSRSPRRVVYEDLEDTGKGWVWSRHTVRLSPPYRWHSDSTGSHREIHLDYRLTRISDGRTRLVLTARRRPTVIGEKNPSKARWEGATRRSWAKLGRALERDFRNARSRTK